MGPAPVLGAGLLVIAGLLLVGVTVDRPGGSKAWAEFAAVFVPPLVCVGVTWMVVGRVNRVSCLPALLSLVVSFIALAWVVLWYGAEV